MKDLQNLSERELLLLTLQEQKRIKEILKEHKSIHNKLEVQVEKHEKFKNTMIGAMATSITASLTAFFKSF